MESRRTFLEAPSHRIRFAPEKHCTPKHCSWLNQIEIWFSGSSCRVLNRGNFCSVDELKQKTLEYIAFYNMTAKPMKWKYDGKIKNNLAVTNVIETNL